MPIFSLTDELIFPHPKLAKAGVLAVGGDLSPERLLLAYSLGIFPWYNENSDIIWWSPDPRMVLYPGDFKLSASLKQTLNRGVFDLHFDTAFEQVIESCARVPRKGQEGTWITRDMQDAYIQLHKKGFAHSAEAYLNGELAGGLYGIAIGKAFFGESMFHLQRDASKAALAHLVQRLSKWGFWVIDVQQETPHLHSLGAIVLPRKEFLEMLKDAVREPGFYGNWEKD